MKKIVLYVLAGLVLSTAACSAKKPLNVIFMIGDGMGVDQVYAAMVANGNKLEMERLPLTGLIKTYSYDNYTTDSGAGGTALSSGVKTRNGMIGMGPDSVAVESILQQADRNGMATGIVASCEVTHATPASYIAHQVNRNMYQAIAADFLKTDVDVFIGGGKKHFENRDDSRNLLQELEAKGYQLAFDMTALKEIKSGKVAGLLYEGHPPAMPERGNFLPDATLSAIQLLDNNKKGFFLMVEGSQIDWAGHSNDGVVNIAETLDFDVAVGRVLDYAKKHGNTLVIVTADHETGGLTLPTGNISENRSELKFTTTNHTGTMVPVFAFGPGAENFTGIYENIDFKNKIAQLLQLK